MASIAVPRGPSGLATSRTSSTCTAAPGIAHCDPRRHRSVAWLPRSVEGVLRNRAALGAQESEHGNLWVRDVGERRGLVNTAIRLLVCQPPWRVFSHAERVSWNSTERGRPAR